MQTDAAYPRHWWWIIVHAARVHTSRVPLGHRASYSSWSESPSGWWANCSWHRTTGKTQLGTFHEDDVRPDTVDRSYGREV